MGSRGSNSDSGRGCKGKEKTLCIRNICVNFFLPARL